MNLVNIAQKFEQIFEYWQPHIVGELNGQQVKLAKLKGDFIWHQHETEDELFLVIKGQLTLELRDRSVEIKEGEFFVVPRGVEHRPRAQEEVHVMLFEPASTINTGNQENEHTIKELKSI